MTVNDGEKYKGVRGWLLLLCISLTILDPAAIISGVFSAVYMAKPDFERYPELLRMLLISGILRLGLAVFSIYAGASLWRIQSGAPRIARRYLQAASLYAAFALLLPGVVHLPEPLYREMAGATLVSSFMTLLYVIAWYLYLTKSRRVKMTYPSMEPSSL